MIKKDDAGGLPQTPWLPSDLTRVRVKGLRYWAFLIRVEIKIEAVNSSLDTFGNVAIDLEVETSDEKRDIGGPLKKETYRLGGEAGRFGLGTTERYIWVRRGEEGEGNQSVRLFKLMNRASIKSLRFRFTDKTENSETVQARLQAFEVALYRI